MDVDYLRAHNGPRDGGVGGVGAGTGGTTSGSAGTSSGRGGAGGSTGGSMGGSMGGTTGGPTEAGVDSGPLTYCSTPGRSIQSLPFSVGAVSKGLLGCQNPTCGSNPSTYFAPISNPDCDHDPPSDGGASEAGAEGGASDAGPSCWEFLYNPNCATPPCWAGAIFAQSAFGASAPGVCVEPGATTITFWARASRPNTYIKIGAIAASAIIMTSPTPTEEYFSVGTQWAEYHKGIPQDSGFDYNSVAMSQSGVWNFFSVILEDSSNPVPTYVLFKDISWSK